MQRKLDTLSQAHDALNTYVTQLAKISNEQSVGMRHLAKTQQKLLDAASAQEARAASPAAGSGSGYDANGDSKYREGPSTGVRPVAASRSSGNVPSRFASRTASESSPGRAQSPADDEDLGDGDYDHDSETVSDSSEPSQVDDEEFVPRTRSPFVPQLQHRPSSSQSQLPSDLQADSQSSYPSRASSVLDGKLMPPPGTKRRLTAHPRSSLASASGDSSKAPADAAGHDDELHTKKRKRQAAPTGKTARSNASRPDIRPPPHSTKLPPNGMKALKKFKLQVAFEAVIGDLTQDQRVVFAETLKNAPASQLGVIAPKGRFQLPDPAGLALEVVRRRMLPNPGSNSRRAVR
ncbi:hypothetical protein BC831DRAFT_97988 [Entophlyctis helioformis]|nr:hypothetical protein BC831DRAFT_97988 [Entophlyctis helioformis]